MRVNFKWFLGAHCVNYLIVGRIISTLLIEYHFICRYKGRIIYNTRYQENNVGQQQVAGGDISSASQASASTSSSGATAINGCAAVAGRDTTDLSLRYLNVILNVDT